MKKLFAVILLLALLIPSALAKEAAPRILVVFLSRAGENYNVGVTREGSASAAYAGYIDKGNTAMMAAVIAELTGGDLFEIQTVTPYPEDYASMLRVAQEEIDTDARPALAAQVENMADYDVVFIGYPIWHGRMPQAIHTFIESHDLTGKTVIPFNTHEGSGQAGTQRTIEGLMPNATVLKGLALRGSKAQNDAEGSLQDVKSWLTGLGLLKP